MINANIQGLLTAYALCWISMMCCLSSTASSILIVPLQNSSSSDRKEKEVLRGKWFEVHGVVSSLVRLLGAGIVGWRG